MDDETVDELWQILNSDEPEGNRVEQARELIKDWAEENSHDLPEIREFDLGSDEDEEDDDSDEV